MIASGGAFALPDAVRWPKSVTRPALGHSGLLPSSLRRLGDSNWNELAKCPTLLPLGSFCKAGKIGQIPGIAQAIP